MNFPALVSVAALPHFRLLVRFADSTEAIIDFREQLALPIMRTIATPEAFARVRKAASSSFIYWDVDVPPLERPDASSDWLYLQSLPSTLRERFEHLLEQGTDWSLAATMIHKESLNTPSTLNFS
jgi:hypothetical protein